MPQAVELINDYDPVTIVGYTNPLYQFAQYLQKARRVAGASERRHFGGGEAVRLSAPGDRRGVRVSGL